jgi:hypothetical protein
MLGSNQLLTDSQLHTALANLPVSQISHDYQWPPGSVASTRSNGSRITPLSNVNSQQDREWRDPEVGTELSGLSEKSDHHVRWQPLSRRKITTTDQNDLRSLAYISNIAKVWTKYSRKCGIYLPSKLPSQATIAAARVRLNPDATKREGERECRGCQQERRERSQSERPLVGLVFSCWHNGSVYSKCARCVQKGRACSFVEPREKPGWINTTTEEWYELKAAQARIEGSLGLISNRLDAEDEAIVRVHLEQVKEQMERMGPRSLYRIEEVDDA